MQLAQVAFKPFSFRSVNPNGSDGSILAPSSPRRARKRKALPANHLAVLRVLIDHIHPGRRVRLGHPRIAEEAGCSVRTVQNAEARLQEIGAITKKHGGGGFRGATRMGIANEWKINALAFSLVGKFRAPQNTQQKVADMENTSQRDVSLRTVKPTREPLASKPKLVK